MTFKEMLIADLNVFLNDDEFADEAIYTPAPVAGDPVGITAIAPGYPTILTAAAHGVVEGTPVTLDDFEGEDAELINGVELPARFITENTFAVALDTTGKDISVGATTIATPTEAVPKTFNVLFNKEYAPELGAEGYRYWILCKTSDAEGMAPGETIVINGATYKIKEPPQHTENGTSIVELSVD